MKNVAATMKGSRLPTGTRAAGLASGSDSPLRVASFM